MLDHKYKVVLHVHVNHSNTFLQSVKKDFVFHETEHIYVVQIYYNKKQTASTSTTLSAYQECMCDKISISSISQWQKLSDNSQDDNWADMLKANQTTRYSDILYKLTWYFVYIYISLSNSTEIIERGEVVWLLMRQPFKVLISNFYSLP